MPGVTKSGLSANPASDKEAREAARREMAYSKGQGSAGQSVAAPGQSTTHPSSSDWYKAQAGATETLQKIAEQKRREEEAEPGFFDTLVGLSQIAAGPIGDAAGGIFGAIKKAVGDKGEGK